MIIRLQPAEISKYWDVIRYGVVSNPSPVSDMSPEGIRNVLKCLLLGTVQCWATFDTDPVTGGERILGFALTTIAEDYVSGGRYLNIYDLFFLAPPPEGVWEEGIRAIEEFAKANKCQKITAYSIVAPVMKMAEKLGFNSSCRFLLKEIK